MTQRSIPRLALSVALVSSSASAQSALSGQEVDPGISDVSPIGTSLRQINIDPRAVLTFDRIDVVPGEPGKYMRQSGALRAVFPQSDYVATRAGVVPSIPAGTVFFIGPPADASTFWSGPVGASASLSVPLATYTGIQPQRATVLAAEAERAARHAAVASERTEREAPASISTESYRRARLQQIARTLGPGRNG